ncbi:MAG: ribonuclease Z [Candidatus Aenigmatarchaeota archaeon]|nr:MAG: ribonuclease Z [Candidatus Aenigmarchaeota archaeon]
MLEIVFLGTGSGIPTKKRNHAAIWLDYNGEVWLWDCGEGTQKQMLYAGLNFMRIDRIYITHWHADHWAGLIGLIQTMNLEKRRRPLFIYGPEAERFVGDILDMEYWGPRFRILARDVPVDSEAVIHKTKEYEIRSLPVLHTVPAVAYCFQERDRWNVDIKKAEKLYGLRQGPLVGKLKREGKLVFKGKEILLQDVGVLKKGIKVVYTGDTKPFRQLIPFAKEADLLIHDATFVEEREDRMHAGAKEAAEIAREAKVRRLILTHLSRRYQDPKPLLEEAKKIFPETQVAEDFMRIKLKR